ncbi:MAG: hypothetical protein ACYC3I_20080 [Gemmataceae bacterium]
MNRQAVENVAFADSNPRAESAVVEVPVLLESSLLTNLESAACSQGLSAASLVRRLIRDFLYYSASDVPIPCASVEESEPEDATV